MKKYPVSIQWSDEDNGHIATVPGARGLSAFGDSPEEALTQLKIAADAYFESLKKAGKAMPVFEKITSFSGQLRLRLPKSLHAELSQGARREGISLNTYLVSLLAGEHTKRDLLRGIRAAGQARSVADKRPKPY